jgi:hypothetical protein
MALKDSSTESSAFSASSVAANSTAPSPQNSASRQLPMIRIGIFLTARSPLFAYLLIMNKHLCAKTFCIVVASALLAVAAGPSASGKDTASTDPAAHGPKELFNDPAALFAWLDTDKDGKLSSKEFQRILTVTGWPGGSAGSTGTEGEGPSASAGKPSAKPDAGK